MFRLLIILLLVPCLTYGRDTTRSNDSGDNSNAWPVDCPNCTNYSRGQRANLKGGYKLTASQIVAHVNELLPYFPANFIDPRVAVCIAKVESEMYMGAVNGGSTARGLYQILRGTANAALNERPCRDKMPYNWSTMAVSTRAQTFMFLCVAYMKVREAGRSRFDSVAVKRYHGNKSDRVNVNYLNRVRRRGCTDVI